MLSSPEFPQSNSLHFYTYTFLNECCVFVREKKKLCWTTFLASVPVSDSSCAMPGFPGWHSTSQRKGNREEAQLADGSHTQLTGFPSLPESSKTPRLSWSLELLSRGPSGVGEWTNELLTGGQGGGSRRDTKNTWGGRGCNRPSILPQK